MMARHVSGTSMHPWARCLSCYQIALIIFVVYLMAGWVFFPSFYKSSKIPPRTYTQVQKDCNVDNLIEWMKERGAYVASHKIGVSNFAAQDPQGDNNDTIRRGVIALADIQHGDILIKAPYESTALLSVDHIRMDEKHPINTLLRENKDRLGQADIMSLFLIKELHTQDSQYRPYVCLLPRIFTSSMFWNWNKLPHLVGSELYNLSRKQARMLVERFDNLIIPAVRRYPELFGGDNITLTVGDYLWGMSVMSSRNWQYKFKGKDRLILFPLAEMANHRNRDKGMAVLWRRDCYYTNVTAEGDERFIRSTLPKRVRDSKEGYDMFYFSGHDYKKGEEVMINYDDNCNNNLLINYGFAIPGNTVRCDPLYSILLNLIDNSFSFYSPDPVDNDV